MRYSRLVIGLVVIFLALWVLVSEQMAGASADAVVNSRLSTLRAPVAGMITMQPRELGSTIRVGEELASVTDPLVDVIRLNDLEMERSFAAAEIAQLIAADKAVTAQVAGLEARAQIYRAERLAELEAHLMHARARLVLLEQGVATESALSDLVEEGQSEDQGGSRVAGIAVEYARERVAVLEIALRAAQQSVFLGDGYNDAPFSEQRRTELDTVRAGLEADRAQAEARLAAIDARVAAERRRTTALGGGALSATVNGQVWEVLAANGETVQRGQDVMRLADCDAPMVTLSVTESVYNRLRVGNEAVFRLTGDGRSFAASVTRLAGSGAQTVYQNLAVAPSQRHLERYDVALLVPSLRDVPELRCSIGRTGRAFFEARPLDWFRDLWQ